MAREKFTRKVYERCLNSIQVPSDDLFSNGGRIPDRTTRYGSWLRRNDPIGFEVGYQEEKRGIK